MVGNPIMLNTDLTGWMRSVKNVYTGMENGKVAFISDGSSNPAADMKTVYDKYLTKFTSSMTKPETVVELHSTLKKFREDFGVDALDNVLAELEKIESKYQIC